MSDQRGVIKNVTRAKQLNNFKDLLRPRNITPTDIDGLIDYGGKAFIYLEGKLISKQTDAGQRMALEAVINSHFKAGHSCMSLIFEHNIPASEQIPVAHMFVRGIYCHKKIPCLCRVQYKGTNWWLPQSESTKVIDAIKFFETFFNVYS